MRVVDDRPRHLCERVVPHVGRNSDNGEPWRRRCIARQLEPLSNCVARGPIMLRERSADDDHARGVLVISVREARPARIAVRMVAK